jgi:hypothetical protein
MTKNIIPETEQNKNWLKYVLGIVICVLIRLIPFRPPNFEPILATQMPFSRAYGMIGGFIFAFVNIVIFDIITGKVGVWTIITAVSYSMLGIWAGAYFNNKKPSAMRYVKFAIIGTIVYDAVTGLSFGPLFYNQPFMEALTGQIPFTILHLIGNITLSLTLSPLIYKFVVTNPKLEHKALFGALAKSA